jgi:hypothetical protein
VPGSLVGCPRRRPRRLQVAHIDLRLVPRTGGWPSGLSWLALKTRLLVARQRVDADLAAGVDPNATPVLRLRAEEIIRPRYRRRLALSLLRVANEASVRPKPRLSAAVPLQRAQLAESRETLAFVVEVLLFAERVDPRGVAMVRELLADGGSPLYSPAEPGSLGARLEGALHALLCGAAEVPSVRPRPLRGRKGGAIGGR